MNIETIQQLPTLINRAIGSACLVAALGVATLNYDAVEKAFRQGLDHVAEIRDVKIQGVEISFDSAELNRRAAVFPIENFAGERIAKQIGKLNQRSLVRLLQIGTLKDLCVYSSPTAEMEEMASIDHQLEDLHLVTRYFSDDARAFVVGLLNEAERRTHVPSTIGAPLRCYEMTLTAEGMDVRTVIAHMLGSAFAQNVAAAARPAPEAQPAAPNPPPAAAPPAQARAQGASKIAAPRAKVAAARD